MNDLTQVLELEALEAELRFSASDFVGARGRSIARSVRRRRVTRAVGTGGVTVAAVGGLAVASIHGTPESLKALPGSPCASPTPPVTHVVDVGVSRLAADAIPAQTPGGIVMAVNENDAQVVSLEVPEVAGDVIATYVDGSTRSFPADDAGNVIVDGTQGSVQLLVRVSVATDEGQVDLAVSQIDDGVAAGGLSAGVINSNGDCVPRSPSPSAKPSESVPATDISATYEISLVDPNSLPSGDATPSPSARIEEVTSPFECGFELGEPMSGTELVSVVPPRFAEADTQRGKTTVYASTGLGADLPEEPAVFATGSDPATVTTPDRLEDWRGLTFVAVRDGKVSGSLYATSLVRSRVGVINGGVAVTTDLTRLPLAMCPGAQVEREYHVYAVAGQMIIGPDGIIEGPTYAWMDLGTPQLDRGYDAPLGEE